MLKIIGIDPGLADTGVAIITGEGMRVDAFSYGGIATEKACPLPARLQHIFTQLAGVLDEHHPDLMVVEDIFSLQRYPKSGLALGKVTGVILLAAQQHRVGVLEVPVREAKKVLTGNGNASKQQLERRCGDSSASNNPSGPIMPPTPSPWR
jgi:crossover junction endodeoxyribonuclease RuvC